MLINVSFIYLPVYLEAIDEAFRLLRQMLIKFELQSGKITAEQWKKKIEDTFGDRYHRSLCVVESLTTEETDGCIPIERKITAHPWK